MTDRLDDLAETVGYLLDRQAIADCIQRYARALDRLDMELMADCFTDDMRDRHGPFIGGLDEFLVFARRSGEAGALTHHGHTTHSCEIEGDTAHAETYVQFLSLSSDRSTENGTPARRRPEFRLAPAVYCLTRTEKMEEDTRQALPRS